MSEVYVLEPQTKGRVNLKTTFGDVEVNLWSKECPQACRNFVQLCLEGYYDNVIFHRVIKGFLVQTGDPTGTGTGGESIYGPQSFPDEFHPRLKYRYRGLIGLANQGKGTRTNHSQFFITLGRCDSLNNQATLFGKVVGPSLYRLIQMAETEVDSNDRPIHPPSILSAEVTDNPFTDIVPRVAPSGAADIAKGATETREERRILETKKSSLLSFEIDDDEMDHQTSKGIQSAHDVLNDPRLSKKTVSTTMKTSATTDVKVALQSLKAKIAAKTMGPDKSVRDIAVAPLEISSDEDGDTEEELVKVIVVEDDAAGAATVCEKAAESEKKTEVYEDVTVETRALELRELRLGSTARVEQMAKSLQDSEMMTDWERGRQIALENRANKGKARRIQNTLLKVQNFKNKLSAFIKDDKKDDEKDDDDDEDWMNTKLSFAIDSNRAYDLDAARDALIVIDPLAGQKVQITKRRKL